MGEGFAVQEGHVAGYGEMTSEVHGQILSCLVHANEARPSQGYTGLMALLSTPVDAYVGGIFDRVSPLSRLTGELRDELVAAAWDYHGTDASVYEIFIRDPLLPHRGRTEIKDFPTPVAYSAGTEPALDAPGHEEPPIKDLVDEVGGSINAIDWVVEKVAGFSPVQKIVEPLSGNWTELERVAEILTQLGDGFDQCADNLTTQLARLGGHWDGGAAISFEGYVTKLANGIAIEGPINRLMSYVFVELASQIEGAADFMVGTLKTAVDKVAQAVATGWIPFVGWYKAYDAVRTVIHIFNQAKELVESIETAIDTVESIIDAVKDPIGFVTDKAEEELAPYVEGADIAADILRLDPTAITEAPDTEYDVGANPRRAG